MTALTVENVAHKYPGKDALKSVDFSLLPGQFLALLGPNGAGKSTLFALMTRLLRLQQGDITIDGLSIRNHREHVLKQVGIVFQQTTLDPDLTVAQNLYYHAALHGISSRQARPVIEAELTRLQLPEAIDTRVRKLNGGHKRRVEIARALLHKPQLLLLDEATAGLDMESRELLLSHVRELCQQRQTAVLWTTHLIDEVSLHDPLVILHRGQVEAKGACSELLARHECDSIKELFVRCTGGAK